MLCWEINLHPDTAQVIQDGYRRIAICPSCAGSQPRGHAARTAGAEDYNVAKPTRREPDVRQQQGSQYASRFPGGKPLHDEAGKLNWQWEKVGDELVGEFLGIKPYENGHIAKVREAESGTVRAFSAPSVLASYLENAEVGGQYAIVFSGEKPPKKRGQSPIKLFEVYELEG